MWADVQRRIRRRKHRRAALVGAIASVVVLAAGGLALAVAASGDDDAQTQVVDAGPGPSTTAPPAEGDLAEGEVDSGTAVDGGRIWIDIEGEPPQREGVTATWTGQSLVVAGGLDLSSDSADGPWAWRYDDDTATWRETAPAPLARRQDAVAVWTGTELLLWGGKSVGGYEVDGVAYDPARDSWRVIPPAPLPPDEYDGVWTGSELVVVGGGEATVAGAVYDPATDTWRPMQHPPLALVEFRLAVHGGSLVVVGGSRTSEVDVRHFSVMRYDPAIDTWSDLGAQTVPFDDVGTAVAGDTLVVWSNEGQPVWRLDLGTGGWTTGSPPPVTCVGLGWNATASAGAVVTDICGLGLRYDVAGDRWEQLRWPADRWIVMGAAVFPTFAP